MSNKYLFRSRKLDDAPQNNGVILSLPSSSLFFFFPFILFYFIFFFSFSFNPVLFRSFFTQRLFQYIPDRSLARMITLPDVLLSNTLDSLDFCANLSCMLLVIKFCASLWPSFEVRAMPSFNRFMSCSIE